MAGWVVGAADEVVQGHVIEVGQGDENKSGRDSSAIFVALVRLFSNANANSNLALREIAFQADLFELG